MANGPEDEIDNEIEIDLADDGSEVEAGVAVSDEQEPQATAEPEPEPAQEEEQPKRRNRLQDRVSELARRAAEAEARAEAAERARLQYEQQLATERTVQVGAMESALKAELASVKRELVDAKTLGDYAAEVEATAKLAKLSSDLSAIEAFKASQPKQAETEQPRQQQQQPQRNPIKDAWVATNTWFDQSSPDYDYEKAVDAAAFAQKLEARLQREGKAAQIGSREYFTLIDEHIAALYPDEDEPAPARKVPAMKTSPGVAPVSRQTAQVAAAKPNKITLTKDQRDMAERMNPNLPPQKAWAIYARNM